MSVEVEAAGAIVWWPAGEGTVQPGQCEEPGLHEPGRTNPEQPEPDIYLIHRPRYDDWSFPKGKRKHGEEIRTTAIREVYEETGLHVALGCPLPDSRYRLSSGRPKVVHFWCGRVLSPDAPAVRARPAFHRAKHAEVDSGEWMPAAEAMRRLTSAANRKELAAFLKLWRKHGGCAETAVLVRHARAKKRSAWKGAEAERPLTSQGAARSVRIGGLLSAYGVAELHTSPWRRCAQTLEPYAAAAVLTPITHGEVTEDAFAANPDLTAEVAVELLARPQVARALCVHRPTLGAILKSLAAHAVPKVRKALPAANPWLKTGECMVLHVKGGRVVAMERVRPLASV